MKPQLYVIIVTYNGEKWIERCLESVYKSTIEAIPLVVDNGSTDKTIAIIKNKYPQTQLIISKENLGFGKANNIGIVEAVKEGAEYVYLLNQDAWVAPDVFEVLVFFHTQHKEFGILSPLHLTGDGAQLDQSFKNNSVCSVKCPNFLIDYNRGCLKDLYETTFVMAAHWLLYVPYLREVGLFSPIFPHYGEDSNLCHRFRYWKYKIGIIPSVNGFHDRQYRRRTPEQLVYLNYIELLNKLNNPLITSFRTKASGFILFIVRNFKIQDASFYLKWKTLFEGFHAISKSTYYLKTYKKKIEYEYFTKN